LGSDLNLLILIRFKRTLLAMGSIAALQSIPALKLSAGRGFLQIPSQLIDLEYQAAECLQLSGYDLLPG